MELTQLVADFAVGLTQVDARRPIAVNQRSKLRFQAGIGPHSEAAAVRLIGDEMLAHVPERYSHVTYGISYPSSPRQKCDLGLACVDGTSWVLEVKLLRFRGDNGQPNDNMLMHILSPYPAHRSALTDCEKLLASGLDGRKAVLIYGFDDSEWPLETAIAAFETLARARARLGTKSTSRSGGLCHPVHQFGVVFAWELLGALKV